MKVPSITLRTSTERQETIMIGSNILSEYDSKNLLKNINKIFNKKINWKSPYGNGKASSKIYKILKKFKKNMKLSVVVPVFNEEQNILSLLKKIKINISDNDEIIVVEDGSSDRTLEEVKKIDCKLIIHDKNIGKGQSLIDGINFASGDIILFLDGDGQDDPSEIPKLIKGIDQGYDFVIGSRFVEDEQKK